MRIARLAFALLALALAFAACGDGGGGTIPPVPEESEFSRLWPNADGNTWTFDYQRHIATESIIPQIANLESLEVSEIDYLDLESRLTGPLPASGEVEDIGIMTLEFRGTVESRDGPKQNLDSTFEPIVPARALSHGHARAFDRAGAGSPAPDVSPLMARVYLARPDLRATMLARGYVPADVAKVLSPQALPPFQVLDGKFEKQDRWIGLYGDVTSDSSYTILKSPITEGTSFRHQLAPSLSDDIWEYGWVLGARRVETPAGTFERAIGVVYFLDFGIGRVIDDRGGVIAEFRSFTISVFYFAPDVGPVYQRTIDFLAPPIPELAIEIGTLFSEVSLREFNVD